MAGINPNRKHVIRETHAVKPTMLLLDEFRSAELEDRRASGICRTGARSDLFVDQEVEDRSHFIVQIVFDPIALQEVPPEDHDAGR
jgi:hypothetical protein